MSKHSDSEAEAIIRDEFSQVVGRVIYVNTLYGYIGDNQVDLHLDTPVAVKVVGPGVTKDLYKYVDEWLDPDWDVTLLTKDHPEIPTSFEASWVYGHSLNTETGERQMLDFRFETWQERVKRWWPSRVSLRGVTVSRGE
jgi:hypothetical protein